MEHLLCVVVVLKLLFVCGLAQSPCPEIFEYENNNGTVSGLIKLRPSDPTSYIIVELNFTVAAKLSTRFAGRLELLDAQNGLQRYNQGHTLMYRVHFPVSSPLPRVTSIVVNDRTICYGPGDEPLPSQYVSTIKLRNRLYLPGSSNSVFDPNQEKPSPVFSSPKQFIDLPDDKIEYNQYPQRPTQTPPVPFTRTTEPQPQINPQPTNSFRSNKPPRESDLTQVGCGVVVGGNERVAYVHHGQSYDRGYLPWLVAMYKMDRTQLSYVCGGTLISNRHVVTAAHCMGKKTLTATEDVVVRVGVYDLDEWGDENAAIRTLRAAKVHDDYVFDSIVNDIAVLTLSRTVEYSSFIRPACLWDGLTHQNNVFGSTGIVAGWGTTEISGGGRGLPRMAYIPIVSTSTCRASNPAFHAVTPNTTLCAGNRNGIGPCLGDSGGGLYILEGGRWRLRGVVSISIRPDIVKTTCDLSQYVIFTDAAQYIPWIQKILQSSQV